VSSTRGSPRGGDADDTIAALATAAGGGVGILRLSGPRAIAIASAHMRGLPLDVVETAPRKLLLGVFHDGRGRDLDQGLAVVFPAPHSMTGEDVAELHLHGGALHLRRCLDVLYAAGARPAEPGEFLRRAFLHGQIDLTRAEAIADLIAAQTDRALGQARAHLAGGLHARAMAARGELIAFRAELEARIDFPDEDLPALDPVRLVARMRAEAAALGALAGTYRTGHWVRDGARVVLAGPPNAGKSSLFNALCQADRAIVTPIPGTTRDTLEETLDVCGIPVVLIDTAGLHATEDPIETLGIARTERAVAGADLVLRLVPPGGAEPPAGAGGAPELVVYSKRDLWPEVPAGLAISAATGEGLAELITAIADALGARLSDEGLTIARDRQRVALEAAAEAITRAADAIVRGEPPELAAVDLQDALDALAELVGLTSIEDVLDRLFATFCIGK
jgi:tRNA modification GTPase